MPGGAVCPEAECTTGEGRDEEMASLGQQRGGVQPEHVKGEETGISGVEVEQDDEEIISRSHDLSSLANHSPGSDTGSTSKSEHTNDGKQQAHKDVMVTVAEMKRLPSDKRSRSKASTVEALHYALSCVKQLQANSEYYKLLVRNGQDERRDATVCTLEELERVTSEHALKNTVFSCIHTCT
ncbi:period circadian protein homolog 2-like [Thalassophryne amazonica]|uniref:period circadian protein homolog 2-like n=1 Tax=Thalassophryne amazonica TaxID=390379 RepID=UPI001471AAC5|nr:period circadian protein homolog 2-like [Thalassophryne amazonica]